MMCRSRGRPSRGGARTAACGGCGARIDRDVREPGAKLDWRPLVVLVAVAVSLTLQEALGARGFFMRLELIPIDIRGGEYGELLSFAWWIASRVIGFLLFRCCSSPSCRASGCVTITCR